MKHNMDIVHETVLARNMKVPKLFTGLPINGSIVIVLKQRLYCNENQFTCLILRLNIPVNKFSAMLGRSQLFLGLTSTVES